MRLATRAAMFRHTAGQEVGTAGLVPRQKTTTFSALTKKLRLSSPFNGRQGLNCMFPTQEALIKELSKARWALRWCKAWGPPSDHRFHFHNPAAQPGRDTPASSPHLCIQFHDVSYFVPAKSNKPPVILRAVLPHNNVWLKVCFPLDAVRGGGCSPLGKVRWRVPFRPDVIPETDINGTDVGGAIR